MAEIAKDDLRAAVAAGLLTEAQAAHLLVLAQERAGQRAALPAEDEPFELFRGFAEVFVAVGLGILFAGLFGAAAFAESWIVLALAAGLAWWAARYFTLVRRMVLPSILLVVIYALAVLGVGAALIEGRWAGPEGPFLPRQSLFQQIGPLAVLAVGLLAWFRRFRVPFTMFLLGLTGLAAVFLLTNTLVPGADWRRFSDAFDLTHGSGLAMGTLVFGFAALAGGIWFDMRDPHRLGRASASGFWLHVLAAPALVNTAALSLFQMGPGAGYGLLALVLALAALLALVIDRRSFLTAGIGYLIFLIGYVAGDWDRPGSWWVVLLIVGFGLTALGTFWTELRGHILRALPDFPGKSRLPPYSE